MKISVASYNLYEGAKDAYARLLRFVAAQNIDVLCLQEINDWQDKEYARIRDFMDQAGYNAYAYGNSNTEYKIVTFSRLPMISQTVHAIGFWHCVVEAHVDVGGVEMAIFNVHFNPWNEESRLQEVDHLLPKIDATKPTIVTGDFNSISRQDGYPASFHNELIMHGIMKYGQVELDFRVMDTFANAGFTDVAAKLSAMQPTVPTPATTDKDHELPVRIDYVLVNAPLAQSVREFTTVKSGETDVISDHYPIIMQLEAGAETPRDGAGEPVQVVAEIPQDQELPAAPESENHNTATEGEIKLH